MEIDEQYADVIVRRWMEFTGREAIRVTKDGEQKTWSEITCETNSKE